MGLAVFEIHRGTQHVDTYRPRARQFPAAGIDHRHLQVVGAAEHIGQCPAGAVLGNALGLAVDVQLQGRTRCQRGLYRGVDLEIAGPMGMVVSLAGAVMTGR